MSMDKTTTRFMIFFYPSFFLSLLEKERRGPSLLDYVAHTLLVYGKYLAFPAVPTNLLPFVACMCDDLYQICVCGKDPKRHAYTMLWYAIEYMYMYNVLQSWADEAWTEQKEEQRWWSANMSCLWYWLHQSPERKETSLCELLWPLRIGIEIII